MQDQAILIVRDKSTNVCWECPLSGDNLVIGREETCDVTLNDRQVSRRHATIYRQGSHCFLRDLGSRNGTFVNDNLVVAAQQLQDGDEIRIASRFRIIFVASEATAPLYRAGPQRQGLSLEPGTRRVWVDGIKLEPSLSPAQFRLLEFLVAHSGEVCSRQQVVEAVYAEESAEGITDQAIDALIRRLRERLATGSQHAFIETVRGAGFRLRQPR
jgi:hypothetical protein